jgi:polyketide biosynthesis acyl carrier protein
MKVSQQDVFTLLTQHAAEVVPELAGHTFVATDSLKALGANSMDRADIIMMTLEALSVRCSLIDLAQAQNLDQLAGLIHGKIAHD